MGAFGGLALAAASGWNTFLPLLLLALGDRVAGDLLDRPYTVISSLAGILTLLTLLTVEIVVDKIPRADLVSDVLGAALRPAAGALCCMALAASDDSLHPVLALGAGLLAAGAMHWWRAGWRRVVEVESRGVATPLVSMVEDAMCGLTAVAAVLYGPAGLLAAVLGWFVVRWSYGRGRRFGARRPAEPPSGMSPLSQGGRGRG